MGKIAKACATMIFVDRDAVQAKGTHRGPEIHRKAIGAVDFGGARRDLFRREGTHRIAQHIEVRAEGEVETRILHDVDPCAVPGIFACRAAS